MTVPHLPVRALIKMPVPNRGDCFSGLFSLLCFLAVFATGFVRFYSFCFSLSSFPAPTFFVSAFVFQDNQRASAWRLHHLIALVFCRESGIRLFWCGSEIEELFMGRNLGLLGGLGTGQIAR
jgi:hypothetical protein